MRGHPVIEPRMLKCREKRVRKLPHHRTASPPWHARGEAQQAPAGAARGRVQGRAQTLVQEQDVGPVLDKAVSCIYNHDDCR